MSISFRYHCLRRDISNFSLIKHRHYDGFLVSMHQSGTHWLKHMLGTALADKFNLPAPEDLGANRIIGGPGDERLYNRIPRLVSTHSIPHLLLRSRQFRRMLRFPPFVVLVRDMRAALVSNYEKWKTHYDCTFTEYVRGDTRGKRFNHDIWWCLRFYNAWGSIARKFPQWTLVVRYEDLQNNTQEQLLRIDRFWQLELGVDRLQRAIQASTKENMAGKSDFNQPQGITIVRRDDSAFSDWYDEEDREFIASTAARYCRSHFNYDFAGWDP